MKNVFKSCGEALFISHMLDLSDGSHEENVNTILEMEIGLTGGVEDKFGCV